MNILADILFVTAFDMGVAGVAWATFICQGVSCVLAVVFVFRKLRNVGGGRAPLFSWKLLGEIAVVAVPSTLQQGFISVGNILIQGVINSYGTVVTAGYAAAIKLNNLVITSFTALGNGMSNFTAQNLGAGRIDRVQKGYRCGLVLIYALAVPAALLYVFFGGTFLRLFSDAQTGGAIAVGLRFLRIVAPFYLIAAAKLISDGVLRGAGVYVDFYDLYVYRFNSARPVCLYSVSCLRFGRYLVCLACRLGMRHADFGRSLPWRRLETQMARGGRLPCRLACRPSVKKSDLRALTEIAFFECAENAGLDIIRIGLQ